MVDQGEHRSILMKTIIFIIFIAYNMNRTQNLNWLIKILPVDFNKKCVNQTTNDYPEIQTSIDKPKTKMKF